ncbi:MAG: YjbQ family protein [Candidatus Kerfeldbacteria bacterium]|nr:YjbQ family protein [Candidatus Kerfeldbacteria bacterium]
MMQFTVETQGHVDFITLTDQVQAAVADSGIHDGVVTVWVGGTTAAVTVMEDEEGIKKDLRALFESWAPENADYEHHKRWGDRNGAAHMKSAIVGTHVCIPLAGGKLKLGRWQQILLIDFDEKPRTREITVQIVPAS